MRHYKFSGLLITFVYVVHADVGQNDINRFKWFQPSLILNFKLVCNLEPEFHFDQQHVVTSLQKFVLATGM